MHPHFPHPKTTNCGISNMAIRHIPRRWWYQLLLESTTEMHQDYIKRLMQESPIERSDWRGHSLASCEAERMFIEREWTHPFVANFSCRKYVLAWLEKFMSGYRWHVFSVTFVGRGQAYCRSLFPPKFCATYQAAGDNGQETRVTQQSAVVEARWKSDIFYTAVCLPSRRDLCALTAFHAFFF